MRQTMLKEENFHDKFWKEVNRTTEYILKKVKIRVKTSYTPYELYYGKTNSI